jgi:hypothetical protein
MMMQIDKSNYEIWLIDWLDGNLNDIQTEQLELFLKDNPDLKEEFEELATFRLNSPEISFQYKNQLKKTSHDLSESQLEYLSVAYLENDLSDEEKKDLLESIEQDKEKKNSFNLIQKIKLYPRELSYIQKNKLLKRTFAQNALRWSLIGLSTAAAVTFAVITSVTRPHDDNIDRDKTAMILYVDSTFQKLSSPVIINAVKEKKHIIPAKARSKTLLARSSQTSSVGPDTSNNQNTGNDSTPVSPVNSLSIVNKIIVNQSIRIKEDSIPNTLIALNPSATIPEYDDGRSKLSRFIARAFREKILKENRPKDGPLKAYELAKAGVSGLDLLLGWEMALDERKDANGVTKSVYFSSKILKFNAQVKKPEPVQ